MKVVIMKGLPGSGKSSWIRDNLVPPHLALNPDVPSYPGEIFSADDWHTFDGVYKYDPKRASYAHNECLHAYLMCLLHEKKTEYVVVDNTNTSLVEIAPYVRLAECLGIEYVIKYIVCDPMVAIKRNIHGVPANTILAMHRNLITEIVPVYWNQEVL